MNEKIIYPDLSYRIMEAVFEVHNQLGPGFIESVYEEALVYELELRGIAFTRQRPIEIYYKERRVGKHRLDLVIEDKIVLELKAVSALTDDFKQRTLSYLKATNLQLGILINFGRKRVESQRVLN